MVPRSVPHIRKVSFHWNQSHSQGCKKQSLLFSWIRGEKNFWCYIGVLITLAALFKSHSVCLASCNEQFIIISKLKDRYFNWQKQKNKNVGRKNKLLEQNSLPFLASGSSTARWNLQWHQLPWKLLLTKESSLSPRGK